MDVLLYYNSPQRRKERKVSKTVEMLFTSFIQGLYCDLFGSLLRIAWTSSVISIATGHQVMQRPQPTQPDVPN
jgi:hypothetical protein